MLRGLDKQLLTSLTTHPELQALEHSIASEQVMQHARPHPEQSFDAFLSSFDWKAIEESKEQHPALATLTEHKVAYEQAKQADENVLETSRHQAIILQELDAISQDKALQEQLTTIAPSLTEPLDDYNRHKTLSTELPEPQPTETTLDQHFDQWVKDVDWDNINKIKSQSSDLTSVAKLAEHYKWAVEENKERTANAARNAMIKKCQSISENKTLQNRIEKLAPEFNQQAKQLATLCGHDLAQKHQHGHEYDLDL